MRKTGISYKKKEPRYREACAEKRHKYLSEIAEIRTAIEQAGCRLIYLPPYAPDLNPIERFWANMKKWIKYNIPQHYQYLERNHTIL